MSGSARRYLRILSSTGLLLLAIVCGGGRPLQADEAADDDSYALDRIRAVGKPVISPSAASTGGPELRLSASLPQTGFERRNGASWTSLAEEQQFLSALDAASDRIRVTVIARTLQQRPIQLVTAGPPLTASQIKARGAVFFVCTQHGSEPAGREACLKLARDHAAGTSTTTLIIIPTANPDGVAAGTRANAAGMDINRDHLRLGSPEARTISRVLRNFLPPLTADMHEYATAGAGKVLLDRSAKPFLNADAAVVQQVADANTRYLIPALNAAGYAAGYYEGGAGEDLSTTLSSVAPLRHAPVVLVETPQAGSLSPLQRVRAQLTAARALLRMWNERQGTLKAVISNAARRATEEGAAGTSRYYFTRTAYTDTPPCSYQLSTAQHDGWMRRLDLFGIRASALPGGGWAVSMAQRTQPIIGLLLDARAAAELTAGRPLPCP